MPDCTCRNCSIKAENQRLKDENERLRKLIDYKLDILMCADVKGSNASIQGMIKDIKQGLKETEGEG